MVKLKRFKDITNKATGSSFPYPYGPMVRMSRFHRGGPGSIPGMGVMNL